MTEEYVVKEQRGVHDIWAFILYFAVTSASVSVTIGRFGVTELFRKKDELLLYATVFMTLVYFLVLIFVLLAWIPRVFLHLVFLTGIVAQFYFVYRQDELTPAILYSIIPIVTLSMYLFKIRTYINLTSYIIKKSIEILLTSMLGVLFSLILFSLVPIFQFILIYVYLKSGNTTWGYTIFLTMSLTWSIFNSGYCVEMFNASLISLCLDRVHLPNRNLALKSLKNTLYASGSICLAGSIFLIVFLLGALSRNNSKTLEGAYYHENFFKIVIFAIIAFIFLAPRTFLVFGNPMAFPNIALYGDGYANSMRNSYERVVHFGDRMVTNTWCLKVLFFFIIAKFGMACYGIIEFSKAKFGIEYTKEETYEVMAVCIIPAFFLLLLALQIISSANNALKYIYVEIPDLVEKTDPELARRLKIVSYSR